MTHWFRNRHFETGALRNMRTSRRPDLSEDSDSSEQQQQQQRVSRKKKKRKETLDASGASALEQLFSPGTSSNSKSKRRETVDPREAAMLARQVGAEAGGKDDDRRGTIDEEALAELRCRVTTTSQRRNKGQIFSPRDETIGGDELNALMEEVAPPKNKMMAPPKVMPQTRSSRRATDAYDALFGPKHRDTTTATTGFEFASAATHVPLASPKSTGKKPPPRSCLKKERPKTSSNVRFVMERSEVRTFDQNDPSTELTPVGVHLTQRPHSTEGHRVARPPSPARRATVANSQTLARWKTRFDDDDDDAPQRFPSRRRSSGLFPKADRVAIDDNEANEIDNDDDLLEHDEAAPMEDDDDDRKLTPIDEVGDTSDNDETPLNVEDQTVQLEANLGALLSSTISSSKSSSSTGVSKPPLAPEEDDDSDDDARQDPTTTDDAVEETVQLEPNLSQILSTTLSSSSGRSSLGMDDEVLRRTATAAVSRSPIALNVLEVPGPCRGVWSRVLAEAAEEEARSASASAARLATENARDLDELLRRQSATVPLPRDDELERSATEILRDLDGRLRRDVVKRLEKEAAAVSARATDVQDRAKAWRRLDDEASRLDAAADALQAQAVDALHARCADLEDRLRRARSRRDDLNNDDTEKKKRSSKKKPASSKTPAAQTNSEYHMTAGALAAARRRGDGETNSALRRLQLAEGVHCWRLSSVSSSEVVLDLPHAIFGTQGTVHVGLGGDARPRLLFHRHVPQTTTDADLALRCLTEAPASWLHPEAKQKKAAVVEILLADREDAPAALERLSWFAAKLAALAKELYHVKLRYPSASLRWIDAEAVLTLQCVSHQSPAVVDLNFNIRRGYPDPSSRALASDVVQDQDNLLRLTISPAQGLMAPDAANAALAALRAHGLLRNDQNDDMIPAAMPVPGTIFAIAACVSEALAADHLALAV